MNLQLLIASILAAVAVGIGALGSHSMPGYLAAKGFDETKIALIENGMIEVSSGDDKYRLPAQIKASKTAAPKVTG